MGEYLETTEPDGVNELARHFLEARLEARALPYIVDAGDRAAASYATSEAIDHYEKALQILKGTEDLALARRAYEGNGGALTFGFDVPGALQNYNEMLALAEERGDVPMKVSALNKLGFVSALMQGQIPEAEELLVDAERLASEANDLAGLAECHMTYCYLRTAGGDFEGAIDHLEESATIGEELDAEEPKLFGLTHTANTLTYMTRFDEAWDAAQTARKAAEATGNSKYLSELNILPIPFYHLRNGDMDAALDSATFGFELASRIGATDNASFGAIMMGQVASLRGEYERAIEINHQALELARASGVPYTQALALCVLGSSYLDVSPEFRDKTMEYHDEAMQMLEAPLGSILGASAWAEVGLCVMASGDMEQAGELFKKGLTTPTATMHIMRPRLLACSAMVAMGQGDLGEAAKAVAEARGLVEAAKMRHFAPLIEFADGHVAASSGEHEKALGHFVLAEEQASTMQFRPLTWQAEMGAAGALAALGREKEADTKRQDARAGVHEIGGFFKDEDLRNKFLESAASKLG